MASRFSLPWHAVPVALILTISATISGCANWHGVAAPVALTDPDQLDVGTAITGDAKSPTGKQSAGSADPQAMEALWPKSTWWTAYRDPQLNQLVDQAIRDNPSQAIAAARLQEALALAGVSRAGTLPSLDASASLTRQHWPESGYYSGGFGGQNTFDNKASLSLAYPLDLFGAHRNAYRAALDDAHAAAANARGAQLTLVSSVVRTYIQLSLEYRIQTIQQSTLADQQHVLDLAQRRFNAGIGTQLEISEAQAPLPQSRLLLEQSAIAIALTRNQLATLIGQGPGAGEHLQPPTLQLSEVPPLPSALPAELIGHRPDVVAMRWAVESQARSIDVAKAGFFPNIDLMANGGGSAVGAMFSTFTRLSSMGFTAGPAITLPIFEGGRLRAGLQGSTARYDIAVGQYQQTVLSALQEISDEVMTDHSLALQHQEAADSVASAQRSFDLATTGFKRGLTDYVNVLSAEDRLFAQQQSVARVQASQLSSYASLMVALGGGLASTSDLPNASTSAPARSLLPRETLPRETPGTP